MDRLKTGRRYGLVPPFPGVTPPTMLRAVGEALLRMESAGFAGHPLGNDLRVPVDEDAHQSRLAVDLYAGDEQLFHCIDADREVRLGFRVQLDLDDLLDAAGANHARHADIEVVDAILAGQVRGAGQDAASCP
jgi:hypothetical protein